MNSLKGSRQIYSRSFAKISTLRVSCFGQNPIRCDSLRILSDERRLAIVAVGNAMHLLGSVCHRERFPDPSMRGYPDILQFVVASLLWMASAHGALATGVEPSKDLRIDPAPCVAAAAANDDDKIVGLCGALIDNEKTDKADRLKALIARGAAYGRHDMIDRAIGDYERSTTASIRRSPISSTRVASSGAGRATGPRRWPTSALRSSSTPITSPPRPTTSRWHRNWSGWAR